MSFLKNQFFPALLFPVLCIIPSLTVATMPFHPNKPALNSTCIISDTLRLQLGPHQFNIPREFIGGFSCPDSAFEKKCAIYERNICQLNEDKPLNISQLELTVGGVPAYDAKCDSRIHVSLSIANRNLKDESDPDLSTRIQKQCLQKLYFGYCQPHLVYKRLSMLLSYDSKCYPIEKTKETLDLIRATLENYEVTAKP